MNSATGRGWQDTGENDKSLGGEGMGRGVATGCLLRLWRLELLSEA
jgi:hypothetical protein